MSIKHFIQEVEKGLKSPVYLLYGEDIFLLKEAFLMCAHTIPEADRSLSLNVFDLEDKEMSAPAEEMLDVLNTLPFMGNRRVVIIENIQVLLKRDAELLQGYIANPSPYALLILLHKGILKGQFKDLEKKTKTIPLDIRQQDIPLWIKEKTRQKGFDITNKAVEHLIGILGPDIGLISSEIEKFTLLEKKQVDVNDIIGLVRGNSDYDVFDLVNALKKRDKERVFRISKILMETNEAQSLLGAINWHYGRMASHESGNRAYYDRVFNLLNEADIRIKTSGGVFPVEYLLIRLLQI